MFVIHFTMIHLILQLVFLFSITLANSNLDFQANELFLSEPLSSPDVAKPDTALTAEKEAGTNDKWGLVATDPSNPGDTAEASLVQSADQCPYDSKLNPRKFRLKRSGSSCSPLLVPDQSQPVRDSNQIYTGRTPKPRLDSGQNSRITGKPSRQWKKAPVLGELYKDTNLCGIAHPWPMCATMEVRRIDDGLTIPLDDFSGRWEHEYCRPRTYSFWSGLAVVLRKFSDSLLAANTYNPHNFSAKARIRM